MALKIVRKAGESWRECAERYGKKYGLEEEVLEYFDAAVAAGTAEENAAFDALYDWDLCEFVEE